MKRYMVVSIVDGMQYAYFTDEYLQAEQYRMDCECGMGGYAEVYERQTDEDGVDSYVFSYA